MVSRIDKIKSIIETNLSISGGKYPDVRDITEIDAAPPKFFMQKPRTFASTPFDETIQYPVIVEATNEENLDSLVNSFMRLNSAHPDGYRFTTTGDPVWIRVNRNDFFFPNDTVDFQAQIIIEARWMN